MACCVECQGKGCPVCHNQGFRPPYIWITEVCLGCKKEFLIPAEFGWRVCQDCYVEALESVANRLDPSYDPRGEHTWEECSKILVEVYCWPLNK